ncbi:MAG: methyl-accepting chemotaxis protein [Spirochaetia bacterium]|nr:methyl-accepting chemotaxis protein [Spirochaetia bacterium]
MREKYEAIEDEKRQVEERSREQNQEQSDSSSAIEALSRQCHCVSTGGEIGRRLTSIVKEKTEDATLDLTNRVYRILELSEELNATIQKVIGGLSADEEGLKNDVQLIEEEQEKITVLIEEFTGIRDGYSKEMKTIESYMKSVEEFTVSIDDIADRTNILAINASIEAARAGELGKGFAVIGNEIQELSKTTMSIAEQITSTIAEASKAISSSISLYEERIGSAVKSLKKSGDMHSILIEKLAPQIDSLSAVVSSSSNLSSEIHENVDGMAKELQYQDRIQQIITHLIQFLDEMGQEARKTASIYYKVSKNEQESIKETMVERAARYFTTDEEHDEFGYERPQDNNSEGTSSQSEDFEGDVVLF